MIVLVFDLITTVLISGNCIVDDDEAGCDKCVYVLLFDDDDDDDDDVKPDIFIYFLFV